jgi:hypothetical protein
MDDMSLTDPVEIAKAAEEIYTNKHKKELEKSSSGEFAVIDVRSGKAYVGKFAEDALGDAREKAPNGVFHLIRIGSTGAFRVGYVGQQKAGWDWALRPKG